MERLSEIASKLDSLIGIKIILPFVSNREVKRYAEHMELCRVDYVDENSNRTDDEDRIAEVHLTFIDGVQLRVPANIGLKNITFKVRPMENNS